MNPDLWFDWPDQSRFVFVGQCPGGPAITNDTRSVPGGVFYVSVDAIGSDPASCDYIVQVADSPADFAARCHSDDFPMGCYDAI